MTFEINRKEGFCIVCDGFTDIYENKNCIWICVSCIQEIAKDGIKFIRSDKK